MKYRFKVSGEFCKMNLTCGYDLEFEINIVIFVGIDDFS